MTGILDGQIDIAAGDGIRTRAKLVVAPFASRDVTAKSSLPNLAGGNLCFIIRKLAGFVNR
ncbi:hypothetical protein TH25_03315 [Thalassospira profundimaris]|uniref:Uncharacterized protein n=1 Tax=Thalassospira profundimaris TaxID=502049 RepID=A0A367XIS8_9PROT|nr:hypothetical protein TH25_03315 [Thalassospira profundimaris]